jgi:hypothetical protein
VSVAHLYRAYPRASSLVRARTGGNYASVARDLFFGASASTYSYAASGGLTFAGAAAVSKTKVFTPSSGVTFGGAATTSFTAGGSTHAYTGSGGLTFAGTAAHRFVKVFTPSGGPTFGGIAATSFTLGAVTRTYVGSGGLTFGGAAKTVGPNNVHRAHRHTKFHPAHGARIKVTAPAPLELQVGRVSVTAVVRDDPELVDVVPDAPVSIPAVVRARGSAPLSLQCGVVTVTQGARIRAIGSQSQIIAGRAGVVTGICIATQPVGECLAISAGTCRVRAAKNPTEQELAAAVMAALALRKAS